MRVVAFGCSFTFGQALPDVYVPPAKPPFAVELFRAKKPSIHAWPSVLAHLLKCDVVNNGTPGIGNFQILSQVLNYPFQPDDVCVILWSQFFRHDMYKFKSLTNGYRIDEPIFLKHNPIEEPDWREHNRVKNWLSIHHALMYLENKKIKNYSLLGIVDRREDYPYPNLEYKNFDFDTFPGQWMVDRALDKDDPMCGGGHPGLESHKKLAEIFYNKLTHVIH